MSALALALVLCTQAADPAVNERTVQFLNTMGEAFSSKGELDRAISCYAESIAIRPTYHAHYHRAFARAQKKEYRSAIEDYTEAVAIEPTQPLACNNLAWLYATCPDSSIRDGVLALKYARRACELTGWKEAFYWDTLASAYAESGSLDEAIRWQKLAAEKIKDRYREECRARLRLYEQGRPYRQGMTLPMPPSAVASTSIPPRDERLERVRSAIETIGDIADTVKEVRKAMPSGPPKRSADVIIKSVSVSTSKENGSAWDASDGLPDLKVSIGRTGLFGSPYTTGIQHDTTFASFNEKSIRVSEGDTIRITVSDADITFDDEIAHYEKRITADTLRERDVDWSFGRVLSLRLEFQP